MKVKWQIIFLFFLVLSPFLLPNQQMKEKDLSQKYQGWLKLVSYIILPVEREVLLQLSGDRERDIFIESFWKQRDPTPGTPENEYKDEHLKRYLYANQYYKRGSPREGWMTDMGRIHIILGPPLSIERIEGTAGVHPAQIWFYSGDIKKGLPAYFSLVFFQRGGSGEYKLYNPASDGPLSLLIDTEGIDVMDYQGIYEKIKKLAPTLAGPSLSLIPGQYPYNYQPSPSSTILLANIIDSPKKEISFSYATHFLSYKGIVSTEYLTNYVESSALIALVYEPTLGINFLHFAISPRKISADYFEPKDQYYSNFMLNVSLRKEKEIIYQYTKDFSFYFSPDDLTRIKGLGISIQDAFPLIEGEYGLTILLQNSVGKEFSIFERNIFIPGQEVSPKIVFPLLGYKLKEASDNLQLPFKIIDKQLLVDPQNTFSSKDDVVLFFNLMNMTEDLWKEGEVEVRINGSREKDSVGKSFSLKLANYPFKEALNVTYSIPAKEFVPDYYEILLNLKDGKGKLLDKETLNFIVSQAEGLPHPDFLAKSFSLSNSFLYFYTLASQYEKVNELEKAEANYSRAYGLRPDDKRGVVEFAKFLLKIKKFDKALDLIEKVKEDESLKFDYYLLKGTALAEKGEYDQAIEDFLEGNKIYNSDTRLLNSLGFCYFKTGQKNKALDVWKASLRLNPEQSNIKELIAQIEKELF